MAVGGPTNLNGPQFGDYAPFTPEMKWSVGAQYEMSLGTAGSLTPRLDAASQSKVYTVSANRASNRIDGYTVANARLTWSNADDDLDIAIEVTNLTDKYYLLTLYDQTVGGQGYANGQPGRPREWAVTFKKKPERAASARRRGARPGNARPSGRASPRQRESAANHATILDADVVPDILQRVESMRDQQDGPGPAKRTSSVTADARLQVIVQGVHRLVQHQEFRVAQDCARKAERCRWPPENRSPCCPIHVSYPSGSASMNSETPPVRTLDDPRLGGIRIRHADVVDHRSFDELHVLAGDCEALQPIRAAYLLQRQVIDPDRS